MLKYWLWLTSLPQVGLRDQTLLLQNGKEVWEISCDREESLLDALDKFAR